MYALVEILGKQYKAEEGAELLVDRLPLEAGASYEIDKVLAVVDGDNAKFGTPYVEGAKITATVVEEVKGDKVKVTLRFRGREMAFQNKGFEVMEKFAEGLSEYGTIDKKAKIEGRNMVMYLTPVKKK